MRPDPDDAEAFPVRTDLAGLEEEVDAAGRPAGPAGAVAEVPVAALLLAEAVEEGVEAIEATMASGCGEVMGSGGLISFGF